MLTPTKIYIVLRDLQRASRHFHAPLPFTLRRALRLHNRSLFSLQDIIFWGLTDPKIPESDIDRYISREARVRMERRLNDSRAGYLVDDKVSFYETCANAALPIPEAIAVFDAPPGLPGESGQAHRARWESVLSDLPAGEFICKPALGMKGEGIHLVAKRGDENFLIAGRRYDVRAVYDFLLKCARDDRVLLQRKLEGHPELCAVSGTKAVQSARLVTFLSDGGECKFLFGRFKFIVGENYTDNFASGKSGNLIADIDVSTGRIRAVFAKVTGELGLRRVTNHPASGVPLEGFVIPEWQSLIDLAQRAASVFSPLRVLGWDIAPTRTGPILLEANQEWEIFPLAPVTLPVSPTEWEKLIRPVAR